MTDPAHPAPPLVDLQDLARTLELRRIGDRLAPGETVAVGGLWGSSQACVLGALTRCAQGPWVVIASSDSEARTVADDLETLGPLQVDGDRLLVAVVGLEVPVERLAGVDTPGTHQVAAGIADADAGRLAPLDVEDIKRRARERAGL